MIRGRVCSETRLHLLQLVSLLHAPPITGGLLCSTEWVASSLGGCQSEYTAESVCVCVCVCVCVHVHVVVIEAASRCIVTAVADERGSCQSKR